MSRGAMDLMASLSPIPTLNEALPSDEQMLESIIASPATNLPIRHGRPRLWVAAGAVAVILGVAAFSVLRQDSPSNPSVILCFSNDKVPPSAMYDIEATDDPVGGCAELWRTGVIASGDPPSLTACITADGAIAVIPGDTQVCDQLGLANWIGEFDVEELNLIEFQRAVIESFASGCISRIDASALAEQLIDEFELDGWMVAQGANWSAERPCAAPGIDPVTKTLTVASRRLLPGEAVSDN